MYSVNQPSVHLPRRRADLLTRPRLNEFILDLLEYRLILVVAPPGYGKTSLFVDLAESTELTVGWYAVDHSDDDIGQFLAHFVAAICIAFPNFSVAPAFFLQNSPLETLDIDQFITLLANEIQETIQSHFALVIDDFHLLDGNQRIQQFVSRFVQRAGQYCHLFLLTRKQPKLPDLELMLVRSQVGLVNAEDLAFTTHEIQNLVLQNSGQSLSDADAARLIQESRGWITGMLLSAQSGWKGMHQRLQTAQVYGAGLYDYLARQVLDKQPPELRLFLLHSSPLGEFNARLCQSVLPAVYPSEADWQALMDELVSRNLFISIVEDGERWLCYHPLFQAFLQAELDRHYPGEREKILLALARFYAERQIWDRSHAIYRQLNDRDGLVGLLEQAASNMLQDGRSATLISWLDELPGSVLSTHPALLSARGAAVLMSKHIQQALPLLDKAEALQRANGDTLGLARTLERRSVAHQFIGNSLAAVQDAEDALEILSHGLQSPAIEAGALKSKGINLHDLGDLDSALSNLQKALEIYAELQDESNKAKTLIDLGIVFRGRGDWAEAEDVYQQALNYFRQAGDLTRMANVLNNLGVLNHHRGDYEQAVELLEEALAVARKSGYTRMEAFVLASLGDIYVELQAFSAAADEFARSRQLAQKLDQRYLLFYLDLAEATLYSLKGNCAKALSLVESAERRVIENGAASQVQFGQCYLNRGIVALRSGDLTSAQIQLEKAIDTLSGLDCDVDFARANLYLAIVSRHLGEAEQARRYTRSALSLVRSVDDQHMLVLIGDHALPLFQDLSNDLEYDVLAANLSASVKEFQERLPLLQRSIRAIVPTESFAPARLIITTFGFSEIMIGERKISPSTWYSNDQREIFHYLLAHPRGMPRRALQELFFSRRRDPQDACENAIHRIRKRFEMDVIILKNDRYYFNRSLDYQYDAETFEALNLKAHGATDPGQQAEYYRQMLALYQGPYSPGVDGTWANSEALRLRQIWFQAAIGLAQLCLDAGNYADALTWGQRIVDQDNALEEAHCLVMRAYAGLGDRASVERQFDLCQQAILAEWNTAPSKETLMLYHTLTR